jgi:hypothetical protein
VLPGEAFEDLAVVVLPKPRAAEALEVPAQTVRFAKGARASWEPAHAALEPLTKAAFKVQGDGDPAHWLAMLERFGPEAMLDALRELAERGGILAGDANPITTLGELVSVALRRRLLRHLVVDVWGWNLLEASRALGLGHGSHGVLRVMHTLGMDTELAEARKHVPGPGGARPGTGGARPGAGRPRKDAARR